MKNIHVVLVEPEDNLNIGSVARAMTNFGCSNLHVVAPRQFDIKRAAITACNAGALLEQIHFHKTLEDALSDKNEVVGFSARSGKNRIGIFSLPEWQPPETGEIALLFGPEDTGLRQEHLDLCRWFIKIPTNENYSSLNLSHAVALALYKLSVMNSNPLPEDKEIPSWNEFFQLERILDSVMEQSEFSKEGTPEPVPGIVKSMFRRLNPSTREMAILLAFFGKIDRTFKRQQ